MRFLPKKDPEAALGEVVCCLEPKVLKHSSFLLRDLLGLRSPVYIDGEHDALRIAYYDQSSCQQLLLPSASHAPDGAIYTSFDAGVGIEDLNIVVNAEIFEDPQAIAFIEFVHKRVTFGRCATMSVLAGL